MAKPNPKTGVFYAPVLNKKKQMITLLMIASFIAGMYVDNRFCPKVRIVDGKLTVEWSDKGKLK